MRVEDLGKMYRLGLTHDGSLRELANRWTRKLFKRPEPEPITTDNAQLRENGHRAADRDFWAVRDASFELNRGEVLGIIGHNGAGKSTLLKILSQVTRPTTGRAELYGTAASLLEVGTGFHPELTGRENVYLNGAILGMTRREVRRKFDEIIDFSGVERFIDTPVKRYSSGMKVRLGFAVAAHLEPEILIIDEVLAVGDVEFQRKCLGKMGAVVTEGRTVLFVSHNMQAIRQLCPRTLWISEGRIVRDGASHSVVEEYLRATPQEESTGDLDQAIAALPPDPAFRLHRIEVLQDGTARTNLENGKPIVIRIEYEVFEQTSGLQVYFELYHEDGTFLFETFHNGDIADLPVVSPGHYRSTATVPADFLAATRYELRFKSAISNIRWLFPPYLSVPITLHASGCVHQAYSGYKTPAKLAPLIPWETRRVG